MCDVREVKAALDAWLIPDVVHIQCERELRLPGSIDYAEGEDDEQIHHYTLITMKTPPCFCGSPYDCACEIWEDLGSYGVRDEWALSSLGFPCLHDDFVEIEVGGLTRVEYRWSYR